MTLATRLTIAMVALVLMTAAAVGLLTYRSVEALVLPRALERIATHGQLLASDLDHYIATPRADVLGFRSAAAIEGIILSRINGGKDPRDGVDEAVWRGRIATRFAGELRSKPAYLQFRIIDAAGKEIVRVDRSGPGGAVRVVPDAELQAKGARNYVEDALRAPPGAVYMSSIDLNREHGAIEVPHVPVLRVATLLQTPDAKVFGIVIINLDMRPLFARFRAGTRPGHRVYIVNQAGDYLLYPDPAREFGFEFGTPVRIQDDIPSIAKYLKQGERKTFIDESATNEFGVALDPVSFPDNFRIFVVETASRDVMMAPVAAARSSSLAAGLASIVLATAVAFFMSRKLTEPLTEFTRHVRAVALKSPKENAASEVMILAKAFERLTGKVQAQSAALAAEGEERRRKEAALEIYEKRESLYLAAIESSVYAFITLALDGTVTGWNPGAEQMFGYSAEEAVGENIALIVPRERNGEAQSILDRIARGETVKNYDTVRMRKDGRRLDVSVSLSRVMASSGEPLGVSAMITDIGEQTLMKELFRLAVEASPSGMIMVDREGKILLINAETEHLFGYERSELIGKPVDLLVPDSHRGHHSELRASFVAKPSARHMGGRDLVVRRKDGSEFPAEIGLNPIHSPEGLLILAAVVDVTERNRIIRMKDEFISTVSHELRTPLTSIAGSLGLLTGGAAGVLPPQAMRLLSIAHNNSRRLVRLINDILDIEKIESGKIKFELSPVDVRAIVTQAIEANRGYADDFDMRVVLAPDAQTCTVNADSDRLIQVVTNLLSNAIKFSPRGDEVEVGIAVSDDKARISVRDHGKGVPEEFRARIFDKFAQADASDARQKGGTGLGLNIAKQIVVQHHGNIGFDDAPGGGTIFHVDLPKAAPVQPSAATIDEPAKPQLMLCDDDRDASSVLAGQLATAGFATRVVATGNEALLAAAEQDYAALLIDLRLPDVDGVSLIQRLRSDSRHAQTPIVVVSAYADSARTDLRSSTLNVLDWMAKPIDIGRLTGVINRAIATNGGGRPRVLHVDDDPDVRQVVAEALRSDADIVSVGTLAEAHSILVGDGIDLLLLDLSLDDGFGLDLLNDLHNSHGEDIPVVIFSAQDSNPAVAARVDAMLTKSRTSMDDLVATLRHFVAAGRRENPPEKAIA